jgi:hypothetical protein
MKFFHRSVAFIIFTTAMFSVHLGDSFSVSPQDDDFYCARYDFIISMSQVHMPTLLDGNISESEVRFFYRFF